MRTKIIMLGIGLALSLSATSSYALSSCPSGTITKVGAGFLAGAGKYYWVDYICATTPLPSEWPTTTTSPGTAANSVRFKLLPEAGASYANIDGLYATALTAIATSKSVELGMHTFTADVGALKAGKYAVSLSIINQ